MEIKKELIMKLDEQITFLQEQLKNPEVPVIEQFEIVEHFYKFCDLDASDTNWDLWVRITQKLTDKQRRNNDGKR
jgi:hypothetical protein